MKKPFWTRQWSRPLIASLVTVAALGSTYAAITFGQGDIVSDNPPAVETPAAQSTVSVWDQDQPAYEGVREMTVYRSPNCGCCGGWIEHAKRQGFRVTDIKTDDMEAIKQKYNLPTQLASCHTTVVDGYVMEGHIPVADIKHFLTQKPDFAGLAVPGMPIGTPGMESGDIKQPFEVVAFDNDGNVEVFNEYQSY